MMQTHLSFGPASTVSLPIASLPASRSVPRLPNGLPWGTEMHTLLGKFAFLDPATGAAALRALEEKFAQLLASGKIRDVYRIFNRLNFFSHAPWDQFPPSSGPVVPFPFVEDPRLSVADLAMLSREGMADLVPDATDSQPFSIRTAMILLLLCKIAYQPITSSLWRTVYRGGFDRVSVFQVRDLEGFCACTPGRAAVIVIRGTNSLADWITNGLIVYRKLATPFRSHATRFLSSLGHEVSASTHYHAHHGYMHRTEDLVSPLAEVVRRIVPAGTPLFLGGHSSAGAVVSLVALYFTGWFGIPVAGVYTFGQPYYCDRHMLKLRQEIIGPCRIFRFVHHTDLISRVPRGRFVEIYNMYYIDNEGRLHIPPPAAPPPRTSAAKKHRRLPYVGRTDDIIYAGKESSYTSFIVSNMRLPPDLTNCWSPLSRAWQHCCSTYFRPLFRAAQHEAASRNQPLFTPTRPFSDRYWFVKESGFDVDIVPRATSETAASLCDLPAWCPGPSTTR